MPHAPAASDTLRTHEPGTQASLFPSPCCLQFEPVVEDAFNAWRGKRQFLGLCVSVGFQLIAAFTSLILRDADYEAGGFGTFYLSALSSSLVRHWGLNPITRRVSLVHVSELYWILLAC
eukprot:TRINITY_DN6355_c0_g1_i3.p2 TRINITY_DN6355_c0_g1~~TRINITY_DN6355_c0_g1_i3.p2  ORF type:complete len:119 (+),score=3.00 TRINITY_DN6355_c0_g1_i3:572-928(+)